MTTIYIQRDAQGQVCAIRRDAPAASQSAYWHAVDSGDAEAVAFMQLMGADAVNPLASTDLGLARVTEDLIDLLIDKGLIRFTDLPEGAQAKLMERRTRRASLNRLSLLEDDGDAGPTQLP
jgi:hypothetical protein